MITESKDGNCKYQNAPLESSYPNIHAVVTTPLEEQNLNSLVLAHYTNDVLNLMIMTATQTDLTEDYSITEHLSYGSYPQLSDN